MVRGSVGDEDEEDEEYADGRGRRGESEESFERRWDLLRPPAFQTAANERHREKDYGRDDRDHSYPLLDPVGNCITPSSSELDDILTVTETSKGLNFEYFWEKAHARRGYKPLPPPQPIPTVNNNHRQSLDTPTVVPVISARSPSLASEYYIRLEEHTPQDKSPTLKGKAALSFRSDSMCHGDVELVEIRSGMLGKERVPYCSSERCGKGLQTVRSSEVQLQVPNTGVAEFRDTSSRVTDFSVVDLGDDDEEEKRKSSHADKKSSTSSQAPVLPPKPRSMSMSSANHLHSRPLPAPPLGYRGLPHYTIGGKIETDPHHMSSCPPSTFDHLGLHRARQTLPPSPSLSPSLPPSSHPIYPQPPQMCPPPLPPHSKPQRTCPGYSTAETYSRYNKPQMQRSHRDPLSCDLPDRDGGTRPSASFHNCKETSHSRVKDFDSPVRRENPLRPIYRNLPRPQPTNPQIERQSSSSPTYSDEDDSPFMSPERQSGGTTVTHSSLSEDADPACAELFSRGMKRTQSRLDTILPTIWREDAELQAERVAAAKKSPMHLFLTEISTVTESGESKKGNSWEGEKTDKTNGERWGNFLLPNRGMRRSQSLITELGSASHSWGSEKQNDRTGAEGDDAVTKESFQGDLFLTEINTGQMDSDLDGGSDPVKYLYPAGSRLRPYVCAPGLPSYTEAEEAYSKGIRRSRSLLSEITIGKQESEQQQPEKESQRTEMTREEFLKEIQSAETFLTEIISRQNAAANKKEADPSHSPTPLSPEYESICIDPNSAQTIRFQSESSIRASSKGKDDSQTEAIYAQVTKRAKKSEIKVSMRPGIPVLHIGSHKHPLSDDSNADHCQSDEFVFSEIMPKNGLLHSQTLGCQKEEECADGPALPARGEHTDLLDHSPTKSTESVKEVNTVLPCENKSLIANGTEAAAIGNGNIMKEEMQASSPEGHQTCGKTDTVTSEDDKEKHHSDTVSLMDSEHITASHDMQNTKSLGSQSNKKSFEETERENLQPRNDAGREKHHYNSQMASTPAATPTTPDWDPSTDVSLITPTDSVLSPLTSSSADCLTPSDSWTSAGGGGGVGGGGVGNGSLRALGNETPHRDSAYFSDSDWEGDGMSRRSGDGTVSSRQSSSRAGDRGILTGIEEKTEEEGEMGDKSPLRNNVQTLDNRGETEESTTIKICDETIILKQDAPENIISHLDNDKNIPHKGLELTQRDDSGIFQNESINSTMLGDDLQVKDCVDLIDKLFSDLDDEKGLSNYGGYIDNHLTDGIISQIADCKYQDSKENDVNLHSMRFAETNILIDSVSGSHSKDGALWPRNNDYASVTKTDIDLLSTLDSSKCGNDTGESVTPSQVCDKESRLPELCSVQGEETASTVEPCDAGNTASDKKGNLTIPVWAVEAAEELKQHDERPGIDHNELGLRNLHCLDGSKSNNVATETDIQLAAAELSNAVKTKSPLRGLASQTEPAKNVDKDSCEGLEVKAKELWCALEEDEESPGSGVVKGEFDCHRFPQFKDLHLWPDENDQWASPERRSQDSELRSEFFSRFSNKAWEVGERLVVGQEFWETEENDELAGSEPHPAILEGCEETWNDETFQVSEGLSCHLKAKEKWPSKEDDQPTIQQEENIENFAETRICNQDLKRDIEVENEEIPLQETSDQRGRGIFSCTESVREGERLSDSTEMEENQNFNRWPQNHLWSTQQEVQTFVEHTDRGSSSGFENHLSHTAESKTNVSISISEASHVFPDPQNVESGLDPEAEIRPWPVKQCGEDRVSISNVEEDYREMLPPSNPISCPSDLDVQEEEEDQSDPQVDNFSSVDFPSPPPSIDLDVQDDKLESLDDSFPSPPPSVVESEEFISHINLDDFIASAEIEPHIPVAQDTKDSDLPATTQSAEISASLDVHVTLDDSSSHASNTKRQDDQNDLIQETSSDNSSLPQAPLNNLPELLISEWKDLDEEPLEDFEKLEQLCCISGDEEDSLGDLFLGNLELLESLKKTPDQKVASVGESDVTEEVCGCSTPEGSMLDLMGGVISDDSDKLAESVPDVILDTQDKLSPQEESGQRSPGQTSDVKDQGSLSKLTTKNGLMMQVSGVFFMGLL